MSPMSCSFPFLKSLLGETLLTTNDDSDAYFSHESEVTKKYRHLFFMRVSFKDITSLLISTIGTRKIKP